MPGVHVTEPSGPSFREQFDGQPVVPAALGKFILVELANVAVSLLGPVYCENSSVRNLLEYGTAVATLKGTVSIRLQARVKANTSDNIATTDMQSG